MMGSAILSKVPLARITCTILNMQPARTITNKHYNPKFKKLRALKVMKVDLPNYNEDISSLSKEKIRQKMKEKGIMPARPWLERSFCIASTGTIFEPYVPPEGDGKASFTSKTRAKQAVEFLEKKTKSMMAIRKIKTFDEDFELKDFCSKAIEIYIKAHEALVLNDKSLLRQYVTEKAYPELRHNTYLKTIRWKFLESLEPPRVVHARCTDVISKANIYGQITVRFHTRQQLAVYDRFGRLIHGSEILSKDVLEYVVFEKHLSNLYGLWRIHGKIIPDWMPPKEPSKLTTVRIVDEVDEVAKIIEEDEEVQDKKKVAN